MERDKETQRARESERKKERDRHRGGATAREKRNKRTKVEF